MRHSLAQSFSPVITAVADNRPLFRAAVHWLAAEAVCTHADARGHSTHAAGALTRVDRERARETERGEREAERVEQRERESVSSHLEPALDLFRLLYRNRTNK